MKKEVFYQRILVWTGCDSKIVIMIFNNFIQKCFCADFPLVYVHCRIRGRVEVGLSRHKMGRKYIRLFHQARTYKHSHKVLSVTRYARLKFDTLNFHLEKNTYFLCIWRAELYFCTCLRGKITNNALIHS